jgi:uncharacterized protein (TIGR02145 family)
VEVNQLILNKEIMNNCYNPYLTQKIMRTHVFILILILLPGFFLFSCKTEEKLSGEITGIITDATTNLPLSDAKVVLDRFVDSTSSSSDGKYLFTNLNAGSYDMKASKPAYAGKSSSATVVSGKSTEINFALTSVPEPTISNKYLDFGIDSTIKYFTITNPAQETFNYTIITTQSWIIASPASGQLKNGANTIKVTINKADMSTFIQHGEIQIISLIGSESVRDTIKVLANGVMDNDQNYYNVIVIGTQTWMAQNLKVGETVAGGVSQSDLQIIKKYCYGNNEANCNIYGGLYTWPGTMKGAGSDNGTIGTTRGICPVGWHIPTVGDWTTLINYLDEPVAGLKMKEAGTAHWMTGTLGTNESGFTVLPGGVWDGFYFLWGHDMGNQNTYFWTATNDQTSGEHTAAQLGYNSEKVLWETFQDKEAVSVRCIMNSTK